MEYHINEAIIWYPKQTLLSSDLPTLKFTCKKMINALFSIFHSLTLILWLVNCLAFFTNI